MNKIKITYGVAALRGLMRFMQGVQLMGNYGRGSRINEGMINLHDKLEERV